MNKLSGWLHSVNKKEEPKQNTSIPTSEDDPRLDGPKEYAKTHGRTYKEAFINLCKERGISFDAVMKQIGQ